MWFIDFFKNWNRVESVETVEYVRPTEILVEEVETIIPDVEYVVDNRDKNAPVILIMDDFKGMANLLKDELNRVYCCDVYENFTIVIATGELAGFSVEKEIDRGLIVDVGFLDITLGGVISGVEYDGIDVAIMIKNSNPKSLVKFVTGHTLNRKNPEIFQFITRFENYFKVPIDEIETVLGRDGSVDIYKHIIQKNSDRVFLLGKALERWLDNNKEQC